MFCCIYSLSVLPLLGNAPTAVTIDTTYILLQWIAWDENPLDSGEGPVIAYKVYEVSGLVETMTVPVLDPTSSPISVVVEQLTPETSYRFYLTCVRDGEGGEGSPSQFTSATTLPGVAMTTLMTTRAQTTPVRVTTQDAGTTVRVRPDTALPRTGSPVAMTTQSGGGGGDVTTMPRTTQGKLLNIMPWLPHAYKKKK